MSANTVLEQVAASIDNGDVHELWREMHRLRDHRMAKENVPIILAALRKHEFVETSMEFLRSVNEEEQGRVGRRIPMLDPVPFDVMIFVVVYGSAEECGKAVQWISTLSTWMAHESSVQYKNVILNTEADMAIIATNRVLEEAAFQLDAEAEEFVWDSVANDYSDLIERLGSQEIVPGKNTGIDEIASDDVRQRVAEQLGRATDRAWHEFQNWRPPLSEIGLQSWMTDGWHDRFVGASVGVPGEGARRFGQVNNATLTIARRQIAFLLLWNSNSEGFRDLPAGATRSYPAIGETGKGLWSGVSTGRIGKDEKGRILFVPFANEDEHGRSRRVLEHESMLFFHYWVQGKWDEVVVLQKVP